MKGWLLWAFGPRRWRDHWVAYWESQGVSEKEQMELAIEHETREAEAALRHWKETLVRLGYEGVKHAYFDGPVEEFFDFEQARYFAVTEAWWDGKPGGNVRVFIELSDAVDDAPTVFLEEYMIVAPDGSLVGE